MRLRHLLADQNGFTLGPMMGALLAVLVLGVVTANAVDTDAKPTTADRDRKQAIAAAEAGVNDYLARLKVNPNYWTLCTDTANANRNKALNQPRPATRSWSDPLPGSTSRFSIEFLPVKDSSGKQWTSCDPSNPQLSMLDAFGAFRIRVTGESRLGGEHRSLIATFRPGGFLNYVYYTEYETVDPALYVKDSWGNNTLGRTYNTSEAKTTIQNWGNTNCQKHWYEGRGDKFWYGAGGSSNDGIYGVKSSGGGLVDAGNTWNQFATGCGEITFAAGDKVLGPLHSNDTILVSGTPQFGDRATDRIEVNGPGDGWRGSGTPNKVGKWVPDSGMVTLPNSNSTLKNDAPANLRFIGKTRLRFEPGRVVVLEGRKEGTTTNLAADTPISLSDGQVIYVDADPNRPCGKTYDPLDPYGAPAGCGNVEVEGTYDRSLTVGAKQDIIVREDLKRANDGVVFGLISEGWTRVYHNFDLVKSNGKTVGCTTAAGGSLGDVQIDAAILSLTHSFTVDGYFCDNGPGRLGTLTVRGAIGQKFRGPVGTSGGDGTGYIKDYQYDRRLQFRSPPRFLDPVLPNWQIRSQTEQIPAE
jgi:hypothetical protein